MKKLLLHLDTDISPSTFDQVVAYDSNVDNIIAYGGITVDNVTSHVHGMIFTRSVDNLKNSAIFIGGSNVSASDLVGAAVKRAFFGPMTVSVMLDPNGSNTTAAAIVRKVMTNYDVNDKKILFLGSSISLGWGVEQKDSYPGIIQTKLSSDSLNYLVLNGSIGNYNTFRYVNNFLSIILLIGLKLFPFAINILHPAFIQILAASNLVSMPPEP